jgi:hypothetical protein
MGREGSWKVGLVVAAFGAAAVVVGTTPRAEAQNPEQEPSQVEKLLAHELGGSGVWRRDNPEWTPGSDQPSHWLRVSRWGPGRSVVTSDALTAFADGRCEPLSHIVFHPDPKSERVRVTVFAQPGVVAEGTLTAHGDGQIAVEFAAILPDGTTRRSRDLTDVSRADTAVTVAQMWQDGAWATRDTVRWIREPSRPACQGPS